MSSVVDEILAAPDALEALSRCRRAKRAEVGECETVLVERARRAFAPLPKANNRMELAMNAAKGAFNVFQGVWLGVRIVRGVKSALGLWSQREKAMAG